MENPKNCVKPLGTNGKKVISDNLGSPDPALIIYFIKKEVFNPILTGE